MRLSIRSTRKLGGPTSVLRYSEAERKKAMDMWDRYVEDALPGSTVQLVNEDSGRVVSEYTNNRVAK